MAEGKTITIIQKGKAVQEKVTVKITASNLSSPVITGVTQNSISYLGVDIAYFDDSGTIISVPTNWDTTFGRTQTMTVEVPKGKDIQILASNAHYIPGQNLEAVPGYVCDSEGGSFGVKLIDNIQENVDLRIIISSNPCV